jgi:purine-binding chemotaxis protein CheW
MNVAHATNAAPAVDELEIVAFHVGDWLVGIDIQQIQEIRRHFDLTPVPLAPAHVRGVVNVQGEILTVVDLRTVLGAGETALGRSTSNLIVRSGGESIGVLAERVADVVRTSRQDLDEVPANLRGAHRRFFRGVYRLEDEVLFLLDIDEALNTRTPPLN